MQLLNTYPTEWSYIVATLTLRYKKRSQFKPSKKIGTFYIVTISSHSFPQTFIL